MIDSIQIKPVIESSMLSIYFQSDKEEFTASRKKQNKQQPPRPKKKKN